MPQKLIFGHKRYKLSRTWWQRKHLLRVMTNHLITHERIKTTHIKAKALSIFAENVMSIARKARNSNIQPNNQYAIKLRGIVQSQPARKKLMNELAARDEDKHCNYTRVVKLDKRKGDNAQMAYIEYRGNSLEQYEKALKKEQVLSGQVIDNQKWMASNLREERDFFQDRLEQEMELLKVVQMTEGGQVKAQEGVVRFFEEKIRRVEHDLYIQNKNPYDLRKYPTQF